MSRAKVKSPAAGSSKQDVVELQAQVEAISRVMAVISFDLDGKVIEVNDNFCAAMGYGREEILGRPHRMFVEAAYSESSEYRTFWADLRAGKANVATFRRVGKGGRPVLLQASYNPLFDAQGKVYKVVKFATDLTEQTRAAADAEREKQRTAQEEMERLLKAAIAGDLTLRLDTSKYEGFMRQVGDGMNQLVDSVSEAFRQVKVAVEQIGQAAQELRTTSQMMSSGSVELNRAADESSSSLVKATGMARANSDSAGMANELVTQTSTAARGGQTRMHDMSAAMAEINASAQQIAKIIKVIDEIAFQTNLLALNAAVEAARAGRHGKGFAVVAQEVRNLAERSAKAAKETAQLIEDSVSKVTQGVRIADDTRGALDGIIDNVAKVVDLAAQIASASGEQSRMLESINDSMGQVTESAQAGSQQSNEVASAAEEMGRQMDVLKQRMDNYKILSANRAAGLPAGLTPELLEQLTALLMARGLVPANQGGRGSIGHNDNGVSRSQVAAGMSGTDPRMVLPLDRDERGFGGF
jgi:methyl-accepting chemotaxis protein